MNMLKNALRPLARKFINRRRKCFSIVERDILDGIGLEIGGPSGIFAIDGPLPVYKYARRIDALNYAAATFWSEFAEDGYQPAPRLEIGRQRVQDSDSLDDLPIGTYDFLAASHVLEHLANPIKTLGRWVSCVRPGGAVILVVPAKARTYDRNRPDTPLDHLIEDYLNDVGEDDRTHFAEVLRYHDLAMDSTVNNRRHLLDRTMANLSNRILHHHVFTLDLLKSVGELAGLTVMGGTTIYPYHIVATFKKLHA